MSLQVFEYIIYYTPTEEQKKAGEKPKILVERKGKLAESLDKANMLAARDIPEDYTDKIDQVTIACRPF